MRPDLAINRLPDGRDVHPGLGSDHTGGLLASGNDLGYRGMSIEQRSQVNRLDNLEKLIAGVILEATYSHAGVPQGDTLVLEQPLDGIQIETLQFAVT